MFNLNGDIFYLIFEELRNDKKTLRSCISVNKTWSEIIVPILWKNPWKYLKKGNENLFLNVIISHSTNKKLINNLTQRYEFLTNLYDKPLFDYISLCRHLNLNEIEKIINNNINNVTEENEILNVRQEILKLFINGNTKFTHIYISQQFNYKIHNIFEINRCFSEIGCISCSTNIDNEVLNGLTRLCKFIRELELFVEDDNNNHEIFKLIEAPKKLFNIRLITKYHYKVDESYCEILENSLIKHANIIQNFTITNIPVPKILTSFVNLKKLELDDNFNELKTCDWLEKLSFPFLQVLKARRVPIKSLITIIENSRGYLTEINIDYVSHDVINNKKILQAIYQNCKNLKYLKLVIRNDNILELENLLINCQYLSGLYILVNNMSDSNNKKHNDKVIDWDHLFEVLAKFSPSCLFKFKFYFNKAPKLDSIKLFLDNWKGRHPILLQTTPLYCSSTYCLNNIDFIERYKAEGIIEKYENVSYGQTFDDFEWIQKNLVN
ncbi:hypothetical protein RclHR1_18310003 [Rhizophagus clarus]|uniref:F-box domain-containing protein n=1 Tax=Rhizophagus clarus TaxID=94130 RepID=A0A2Z6QNQ1_9GLOM|nr:hypothetical protein RclHR1_18310003 [Rhizophagus clarus]GES87996.1 hypothetical protein GLOIN_2v1879917 [Rhizophagus clarus]